MAHCCFNILEAMIAEFKFMSSLLILSMTCRNSLITLFDSLSSFSSSCSSISFAMHFHSGFSGSSITSLCYHVLRTVLATFLRDFTVFPCMKVINHYYNTVVTQFVNFYRKILWLTTRNGQTRRITRSNHKGNAMRN